MSTVEIKTMSKLTKAGKYFSRSMNKSFTVIENDEVKREIRIGVDGKAITRTYALFNKQYFANGIIEE